MTREDLEKIIVGGETLTVEFKSDRDKLSDRALVEAVAAMANTDGGVLLLGVEDGTGEITGVHPQHRGKGSPAAMIANRTMPPVQTSVEVIECGGGCCVFVLSVPEARGIVGTSDGYYAKRRLKPDGTPETVPMSPFEIQSRAAQFQLIDPSAQPMEQVPISAVDPLQRERIRQSIRRSNQADKALLELSDEAFDLALGLVRRQDGREWLTMAGVLFLTSEEVIRQHIPTYEVSFQVLDGSDVLVNEHRRRPIVEEYDDIVERFSARIDEEEIIVGARRVGAPTFDAIGFREALTNAIVHRNYAQLGTVIVRLDEHGLSISNPGGLVAGVTLDNLLSTEPRSRNTLLADVAKRIGLAERTGRGVDKIYEGVLRYGRSLPIYLVSTNEVVLRLPRERPDFDFLRYVLEAEVRMGKMAGVDFLLSALEMRKKGRISIPDIVRLSQRKEETIRTEVDEWLKLGLMSRYGKGRGNSLVLSEFARAMMQGAVQVTRQTDEKLKENVKSALAQLKTKGTIRRADVIALCGVTTKQASQILARMSKIDGVSVRKAGRSTEYIWNE